MYISGDYVLRQIFGLSRPNRATIYDARGYSPAEIRELFALASDVALDLRDNFGERSINVDFWQILPGASAPTTCDNTHGVSTTLYQVSAEFTGEDSIRFLALSVTYPWTAVQPHPSVVVRQAQGFHEAEPALAEMYSLQYADRRFTMLIENAAGQRAVLRP